jgi:hypothetical protein
MARQFSRGVLLLLLSVLVTPAAARAQEAVRVTAREAAIRTRPDARSPMVGRAVTGTVLQVVASENNWYVVVIPPHVRLVPTAPDQGYIEAKAVTLLPPGDPRTATRPAAPRTTPARGAQGPGLRWRLFGVAAFERFQASQAFEAVYDNASAPSFGGGLDLISGHVFVQGEVSYLQRTGERVFVFEGEVFPLGIPQKLKLTTLGINGGYRFGRPASRITPYLGAGVVVAFYNEEADAAGAADDDSVSENGTGGQALGGVEFRISRWLSAAIEGRYRYIPGVLGDAGVSKEFAEDNLGGGAVAVKLVFGR